VATNQSPPRTSADLNWRYFVAFRVLFNARFYYPVFAVLFLDYGLSIPQFTVLNFVWAVTIVCLDLPLGALADHIGRRPLVIAAGVCMVIEFSLLAFVPLGHPTLLFWIFLLNRVISGAAEACASGADEALVFDSLAEQNRGSEWPRVLDEVLRWQSAGFIVAMLVGGAIYDPRLMQRLCDLAGIHVRLTQQITMRFPIYLNMATACVTLFYAIRMREPVRHTAHTEQPSNPLRLIVTGGRWILATPLVTLVVVAGFLNECIL
jgi:MFS family permease